MNLKTSVIMRLQCIIRLFNLLEAKTSKIFIEKYFTNFKMLKSTGHRTKIIISDRIALPSNDGFIFKISPELLMK